MPKFVLLWTDAAMWLMAAALAVGLAVMTAVFLRQSASVEAAALLLTDLLWQRVLAQPLRPDRNLVLFTGGGIASGRTSAHPSTERPGNS